MLYEILYAGLPIIFTIYSINIVYFNIKKEFEIVYRSLNEHEEKIDSILKII